MRFVLGGGCFWCLEAVFQEVVGVKSVVSGYAGGIEPNPTYESVHEGRSDHAEVVCAIFDSAVIAPEVLLDIFFLSHDPTTLNRQGNDVGTAYRSILLYQDARQKQLFIEARERAAARWQDHIVTEIVPLEKFYPAEEEHQNYFKNHPDQMYCQAVIAPKLSKIREKYAKWFAVNRMS